METNYFIYEVHRVYLTTTTHLTTTHADDNHDGEAQGYALHYNVN